MLQKLLIVCMIWAFITAGSAGADTTDVSIEILFPATLESIDLRFEEGSNHLLTMLRREGKAEGSGPLAGSEVTEYGWHDVNPPKGANALGYLQFKAANGDTANLKLTIRAVFFQVDEKPTPAIYGIWELFSGTGQFRG